MQRYRHYSFTFQKALFYPIKVALFERSMSLPTLVQELNSIGTGIKYTLDSLNNCFCGKNISPISLNYFSNVYVYLNLPDPTPQYLYESYIRWNEIKALKLDKRNANRIKKGLHPVNSLSRAAK